MSLRSSRSARELVGVREQTEHQVSTTDTSSGAGRQHAPEERDDLLVVRRCLSSPPRRAR
jgi:hypothetical protein